MSLSHGESETRFVRDRVIELVQEAGFALVTDTWDDEDGWRGEFLKRGREDDVIHVAHKPQGAPYVTLGSAVPMAAPGDPEGLRAVIDAVSDYDCAFWFQKAATPLCHLTSRLFVSGLNHDDFHFHLTNLLLCREGVLEMVSERRGGEAGS